MASFALPSTAPAGHGSKRQRPGVRSNRAARAAPRCSASDGGHGSTPATSSTDPTRRDVLAFAAGLLATTAGPLAAVMTGGVGAAEAASTSAADVDTAAARGALRAALEENIVKTKAPAVLRLVFHDSGTFRAASGDGGMNGSVRFELARPESFGLKRGLG
jgi:L-ascorbate peroxidase